MLDESGDYPTCFLIFNIKLKWKTLQKKHHLHLILKYLIDLFVIPVGIYYKQFPSDPIVLSHEKSVTHNHHWSLTRTKITWKLNFHMKLTSITHYYIISLKENIIPAKVQNWLSSVRVQRAFGSSPKSSFWGGSNSLSPSLRGVGSVWSKPFWRLRSLLALSSLLP